MTNLKQPREIELHFKEDGCVGAITYPDNYSGLKFDAGKTYLLREATEPSEIGDTERLDWMIDNRTALLSAAMGEWWLFDARTSQHTQTQFKTPREAIDAAMKEGKG